MCNAQSNKWRCVEGAIPTGPQNAVAAATSANPNTNLNLQRHAYKVVFHIIRDNDGNRDGFIGEEIVMNVIRDLNLTYKSGNIYFKYGGIDYVDDSDLSGDKLVSDLNTVFSTYVNDHSVFHLIVLNGTIVLGYDANNNPVTVPGFGPFYGGISYYNYQGITSRMVPVHEVGHNFGLRHNFSSTENVVRTFNFQNPNENGYNANTAGDFLVDTPACRAWPNDQFNSQGVYIGNDVDYNVSLPVTSIERRYSTYSPKIYNVMYVPETTDLNFVCEATPQQIEKMHSTIVLDLTANPPLGTLGAAEVPWEELYKPFETINVQGETVISMSDNLNGTVEVCTNILRKDRFQKGFNISLSDDNLQVFRNENANALVEYVHGVQDYQVRLEEVDPEHYQEISLVCLRGQLCRTEAYTFGKIYSVRVLGDMNITERELTQIELKDPDLYAKLMTQYYYILKKYTESGLLDEKIIYKP
jgi:hypothetical protein